MVRRASSTQTGVSGMMDTPGQAGAMTSVRRALSIILQQPLDVIEFDLRAGRIGETAAQFFEDPAHPLHSISPGIFTV